jgi:hypothetical protein
MKNKVSRRTRGISLLASRFCLSISPRLLVLPDARCPLTRCGLRAEMLVKYHRIIIKRTVDTLYSELSDSLYSTLSVHVGEAEGRSRPVDVFGL